MDLIMTKWAAVEGAIRIAKAKDEELIRVFPRQMLNELQTLESCMDIVPEVRMSSRFGAEHTWSLGEGGIFTALWIAAEQLGTGLEVELRKIPVRQEVIEICEYYDLNPYYMLSGGSLLIAAPNGQELVSKLMRKGIPAALIGWTTKGNDKIISDGEHVRYLDRPQKEELYKIFKEGWNGL